MDEQSEIRPLPNPPRCRGIPLGDGNYTGCSFGFGDVPPFTPPCDCPTCNGSGYEGSVDTTLPHSSFGAPECCGCLVGHINGTRADIVCNECATVVRTVAVPDLQQTLTEMELTLELSAEMCPHCGAVTLFPGFSSMRAFVCCECGKGVVVRDPAQ
jgi:hypothetical protein